MTAAPPVVGDKFHRLTVLDPYLERTKNGVVVLCVCDCGENRKVLRHHLLSGRTKSCGCLRRKILLEDEMVGRWTVKIPNYGKNTLGDTLSLCICACGTERVLVSSRVRIGRSQSCGCLGNELLSTTRKLHGKSLTVEYCAWYNSRLRCNNPECPGYDNYGGRGISMCSRWSENFENFLSDVGHRPGKGYSLDRIDVNGNYEPGNVRWATWEQQANNKRSNVLISTAGETKTLGEWCRLFHLNYATIASRLRTGWEPEQAILTPVRQKLVGQ